MSVITVHRPARGLNSLRSEEHTSELQSRFDLVCRLLLEKKKNRRNKRIPLSKGIRGMLIPNFKQVTCREPTAPPNNVAIPSGLVPRSLRLHICAIVSVV